MAHFRYLDIVEATKQAYDCILSMERDETRNALIADWIDIGNSNIQTLQSRLTARGLPASEKSSIQNALSLLKTYHEVFIRLSQAVVGGGDGGGGGNVIDNRVQWQDLDSAFNNRMRTGVIINHNHVDLRSFLADAEILATEKFRIILRDEHNIKANAILACKFENIRNDELNSEVKYFNTPYVAIFQSTDIKNWFKNNVTDSLLTQVEDFEHCDSGWSMIKIVNLVIGINRYDLLRGGLSTYVPVPTDIQNKKAVVNVKNEDNWCFVWSVLAALHPTDNHPTRTSSYKQYFSELNIDGLDFPLALKDVSKFEKLNNLAINVYGIESQTFKNANSDKSVIVPLYLSHNFNSNKKTIHLLMIISDIGMEIDGIDNYKPVFHFACIKNLSRLVSNQISRHHGAVYICDRCLCSFSLQSAYDNHRLDCIQLNEVRMLFPEKNNMHFEKFCNQSTVPFVVYADLECILKPSGEHEPHSVCFCVQTIKA